MSERTNKLLNRYTLFNISSVIITALSLQCLFMSFFSSGTPCVPDFPQLSAHNGEMENCTRIESFDYFSGSEVPYILTVFFILGSIVRK